MFFGRLDNVHRISLPASEEMPHVWIQVISGAIAVLSESLSTGDGLAVENHADAIEITATSDSKFLAFRLS